jgi:hypothetical protein
MIRCMVRVPRVLVVVVAVAAVTGCGSAARVEHAVVASVAHHHRPPACIAAGRVRAGALRVCPRRGAHGAFVVGGRRLAVSAPDRHGSWIWAAASPDGHTILAHWSGECETPTAYEISAGGGRPKEALPGRPGAETIALGWTTDARAIVFRRGPAPCGSDDTGGVYLIGGRAEPENVIPWDKPTLPPGITQSARARTCRELLRAAQPQSG